MKKTLKVLGVPCRAGLTLLMAASMFSLAPAYAADYPSRPITIVVPFAPGGASDITARLIGKSLGDQLQSTVVVENRAGANSQIGTANVARAKPDGYTLLLGTTSLVNNPHLYANLPYDAERELKPVIGLVQVPAFLMIGPKLSVKDGQEFVQMARKSKDTLNYASAGTGSTLHLATESVKEIVGFDALHIPQRGSGPAVIALASGEVDFSMENYGPALPQLESGRIRVLAVASPNRFPVLPDVPTFKEIGLPDTDLSSWFGLMAPTDTPDSVIELLNKKINVVLQEPDIQNRLMALGLVPFGGSADDMSQRMQRDSSKWSEIIRSADIKVK